jgi:hypothetical protein
MFYAILEDNPWQQRMNGFIDADLIDIYE